MSAITLENVSLSFAAKPQPFTVLEDISLSLNKGEFVVLLGPSGCGKSTILNLVAGFTQPDRGRVAAGGKPVRAPGPDRGMIFQQPNLFPWLSVLENVLLPSIIRARVEQEGVRERAEVLLEGVDLAPLADARPDELSGGELRRMAVARALVMRPETVLADEPTAGLDAGNAQTALRMLRRAADEGAAVLVVTHEDEAVHFADRVMVMESGVLRLGDALRGGSPACEDLN